MRVLAVYCAPRGAVRSKAPGLDHLGFEDSDAPAASLLASRPDVQLEVMRAPSLAEFSARVEAYKPSFVYLRGASSNLVDSVKGSLEPVAMGGEEVPAGELITALEASAVDTIYLDASGQEKLAELLRWKGVPNVLFWSEDPSALVASHFAAALFGCLALEPHVSLLEGYALALFAAQAYLGAKVDGRLTLPNLPELLSGPLDEPEAVVLALPDNASVPPPQVPGLDLAGRSLADAVPGWWGVRLLAPRAELQLQVAGGSSMLDPGRLSYVGEALRALLVLEARRARLMSSAPPPRLPAHLPEGSSCLLCELATASGARARVVLGGAASVLGSEALMEHALRHTLVADALSLQFRLPPPGVPLPQPHYQDGVLRGSVPVVEALLLTSVWAVAVLRQLAQDATYRGLANLGIGSVGGAPVAACSEADATRFMVIVSGQRPGSATLEALLANGLPEDGIAGSLAALPPSTNPLAIMADPPIMPHACGRPPLEECSEDAFLDDLLAFRLLRSGRAEDRAKFPDAKLNGQPLDLFTLYKEVCARGGFKVGNGINWKGQVFGRMRNWTANHKQTGVGNSLKKHYAGYLWEYEQAHPDDVVADRCTICGRGEEAGATDWIACDSCNAWVHFSCDKRPGLGVFADYDEAEQPRSYTCPHCANGAGPDALAGLDGGAADPMEQG